MLHHFQHVLRGHGELCVNKVCQNRRHRVARCSIRSGRQIVSANRQDHAARTSQLRHHRPIIALRSNGSQRAPLGNFRQVNCRLAIRLFFHGLFRQAKGVLRAAANVPSIVG